MSTAAALEIAPVSRTTQVSISSAINKRDMVYSPKGIPSRNGITPLSKTSQTQKNVFRATLPALCLKAINTELECVFVQAD